MTVVASEWPETEEERDVESAGGMAMSYASAIFDVSRFNTAKTFAVGERRDRVDFTRARAVLARAEEVEREHPDAVFMYEGAELLLSEAVKHLRGAIERREIYDR